MPYQSGLINIDFLVLVLPLAGGETRASLRAIAPAKGISCHTSYWRTRGESFQLYFQLETLREELASQFYSFAESCLDSPLREQPPSQITGWTSYSKKKMATEANLLQSGRGTEARRELHRWLLQKAAPQDSLPMNSRLPVWKVCCWHVIAC